MDISTQAGKQETTTNRPIPLDRRKLIEEIINCIPPAYWQYFSSSTQAEIYRVKTFLIEVLEVPVVKN